MDLGLAANSATGTGTLRGPDFRIRALDLAVTGTAVQCDENGRVRGKRKPLPA